MSATRLKESWGSRVVVEISSTQAVWRAVEVVRAPQPDSWRYVPKGTWRSISRESGFANHQVCCISRCCDEPCVNWGLNFVLLFPIYCRAGIRT